MKRVPVLLVTGFLGSGKTTFINWLLEKSPDSKISIILNEFGNIHLESKFVTNHPENVVELANGCMCCVAKSDVPRVVSYILEQSPQTEYIVIEASGLSDPDPVREALQTQPLSDQIYLEGTVCIIDTVNFESMRGEHPLILSQIADADIVLLAKVEIAGEAQTTRIQSHIQNLTPDVRVIPFTADLVPEIFLSTQSFARPQQADHDHHHLHEEYQTYVYETESPLNIDKLHKYVQSLPESIIRVKGIVYIQLPNQQFGLAKIHRVGAHVTVHIDEEIPPTIGKSVILCIGKELDQEGLRVGFEGCVA